MYVANRESVLFSERFAQQLEVMNPLEGRGADMCHYVSLCLCRTVRVACHSYSVNVVLLFVQRAMKTPNHL